MRAFSCVVALLAGAATAASAQLAARQEPTEQMLVLPFQAAHADSAASIVLADAVRDRLAQLTRNRVAVVPKAKLCEALRASGFPCDILLDDQQSRQLARFLQVDAYLTGTLEKSGTSLVASIRVVDIGSSGMAVSFTVTNGNPAPLPVFADTIAQRVASVVRISENVRQCNNERQRGQFRRATSAAQKALEANPNSAGAHLCIATVYEAQRMPVDSMIAASQRALAGDSLNATAWENIARGYQQKGDTTKMIDAFIAQLRGPEARNTGKRLGIAQLLRQMKQYERAVAVLDEGLAIVPGDPQLLDFKTAMCVEASLWRCAVEGLRAKAQHDSTVLADTAFLKSAIGAAQQVADSDATFKSEALLIFTGAAVRQYPSDVSFVRARAAAFELAGQPDSARAYYQKALQLEPGDVATSLQLAKSIVDRAVWDTAGRIDTAATRVRRIAFAAQIDSARPYLRPGLSSPDSNQRLAAAVIMLTGGSKLAQAAAYDRANPWLDSLLQVVAPKNAADTIGPKHQVRVNASFWYGLSSVLTLAGPYKDMTEMKGSNQVKCATARDVFGRVTRTKAALQLGRRVHPPTADQMLGFVAQYERAKPQVQRAFRCSPALN